MFTEVPLKRVSSSSKCLFQIFIGGFIDEDKIVMIATQNKNEKSKLIQYLNLNILPQKSKEAESCCKDCATLIVAKLLPSKSLTFSLLKFVSLTVGSLS